MKTRVFLLMLAICVLPDSPVLAHEGPPFPVAMDEKVADYVVSVWADPDIGDATFFVILEAKEGNEPTDEPVVSLWIQPVGGRMERVLYPTNRQVMRGRMQFQCSPYFDRQDWWHVGIVIQKAGENPEELVIKVESTPPGYGVWDLAIYLFPFVLVGGLWVLAMVRQIRKRTRGGSLTRTS